MDISLPCSATPARAHKRQITLKCHPSRLDSSFKNTTFIPSQYAHIFFIKQTVFMNKVLSVLISINVQAKSDINLGSQGMVITNQGVAIQLCFQQAKYMQFYKTGQ